MVEAGYKRVCMNCKAEHFPRTDPVPNQVASMVPTSIHGVNVLPATAESDCVLIFLALYAPIPIRVKR